MKVAKLLVLTAALAGIALAAETPVLESRKVTSAPKVDGVVDAIWMLAPAVKIETTEAGAPGVANKSETVVSMKSVYTNDTVYFLLQWADPTQSLDYQRWVFDGTKWAQEDITPLAKGGASVNYEDKLAFMWAINAPTFVKEGPWATYQDMAAAGRAGYDRPVKTAPKGESLDLWHWKYVRGGFSEPNQVDDQFLNDAFDAKAAANAGRTSDAGTGGYYVNSRDMKLADGTVVKVPKYGPKNGSTNEFIFTQAMIDNGTYVELTDAQVMALPKGAHIPSQIGRAFTGSRGDITATAKWANGQYTFEIARKLDTGDKERDVIFNDLSKTYYFGIATFDNTQIQHAVSDLIEFKFRK
jgi:hypothetical protein